jgi:hypothetical protein
MRRNQFGIVILGIHVSLSSLVSLAKSNDSSLIKVSRD